MISRGSSALSFKRGDKSHWLHATAVCLVATFLFAVAGCDERAPDTTNVVATPQGTPPPPASPADLAAIYEASPALLAEARSPAVFSQFRPVQDVELMPTGDTLKVTATGPAPQMLLPAFIQGKRFIIKATLTSPAATQMQLFYLRKGQTSYSDAQSQVAQLVPGPNEVYFRFDAPDMTDPLRLDIGTAPGDYILESMVARVLTPPSAAGTP